MKSTLRWATAQLLSNLVKSWEKFKTKKNPIIFQKAEAQLAYELQAAKIQQKIRNEEIQIQVVERRKQIEIEEQEIRRKEKELMSTVKLPAEAEAYKVQTIAEGKRYEQPRTFQNYLFFRQSGFGLWQLYVHNATTTLC